MKKAHRNPTTSLSSENKSSGTYGIAYEKEVKAIKIECQTDIHSVAFLPDGKLIIGGGQDGKIRCWGVEDGKEVGKPMNAKSPIYSIAVSQNGQWIVSGTGSGLVTVWNAESHQNTIEFPAHTNAVNAVDISPDGTRLATASADGTACIWSLSTGQRLLGPWKHTGALAAIKFSPSGQSVATATHMREAIRVYDAQSGHLLFQTPIKVYAQSNQLLAWEGNSKILFALSDDGHIHCLDLSSEKGPQWRIHCGMNPRCIALSSNGKFIAASDGALVSFWDHKTQKRIGYFVRHKAHVYGAVISVNHDIAMAGGKRITICSLVDVLPSRYIDMAQAPIESLSPVKSFRSDSQVDTEIVQSLRGKVAYLEKTVLELRDELAASQRPTSLDQFEIINNPASNSKVAHLEKANKELSAQLADARRETDSLLQVVSLYERKQKCEILYAEGRISKALTSAFEISTTLSEEAKNNKPIMEWLSGFSHRCIQTLEKGVDMVSISDKRNEAVDG